MKNSIRKFAFFCLLILFTSHAGTLSVVISDTDSNPISGVELILTGLSIADFSESGVTDEKGGYVFDSLAIGTYNLALSKEEYVGKDTSLVLGDASVTCSIILSSVYLGIVNGVWELSGSPYIIVDSAIVTQSLTVAPGCSVIIERHAFLRIEGDLIVGSNSGPETVIMGGTLISNGTNSSISLFNTKLDFLRWSPLNCRSIKFDSVVDSIGLEDIRLDADSVFILNSKFHGTYPELGNYSRFLVLGRYAWIEGSRFDQFDPVEISSDSALFMSFCVFNCAPEFGDMRKLIRHNNFISRSSHEIEFSGFSPADTISDNIFTSDLTRGGSDTLYNSPFSHNFIMAYVGDLRIFGLLSNVQTNANGDSCDVWFNIITSNPYFTDSTRTTLYNYSPAIGAASDGTNIGVYQGEGVGVIRFDQEPQLGNPQAGKRRLITGNSVMDFNSYPLPVSFRIMDIQGRTLLDVRNHSRAYFDVSSCNLNSGIYILSIYE